MISIKKLLAVNTETEQTLMHIVRVLVEGIGRHALVNNPADAASFRNCIDQSYRELLEEISPAALLVSAGSIVKALELYSGRTAREYQAQMEELQKMTKMLTSTVGIISKASETNVGRLQEIEGQIERASVFDDVRAIKGRLVDCLTDIRNEAKRQRQELGATIEQLTQGVGEAWKSSATLPADTARDTVTGLLPRSAAEAALGEPVKRGGQTFVAVLVLESLPTINRRFGNSVGDQVLVEFTALVRQSIPPEDQLFRWTGPAIVAVMVRPRTLEQVRSEIANMVSSNWEYNIQTSERSVLLPITARWTVLVAMAEPSTLYQRIDSFVA